MYCTLTERNNNPYESNYHLYDERYYYTCIVQRGAAQGVFERSHDCARRIAKHVLFTSNHDSYFTL